MERSQKNNGVMVQRRGKVKDSPSRQSTVVPLPEILAPAGNKASFLAALAAGADAIYCGLKHFSARMAAKNFTLDDLVSLTRLAHDRGTKVYIALNSLLKPDDLNEAGRLLDILGKTVRPDALIIQDLSLVQLARQTGFPGELHLSTLANVSFPGALKSVQKKLGIDRVVIPRELDVDEIKAMADGCPENLGLEVFVHGALCYGVSGRCYWSSYMGGKSGLRGRCVQPCRRLYRQRTGTRRFFSCQDLSLDVLTKVLLTIPRILAWKIEGRKKGPHYVYHTVKAYRILRDAGLDPTRWAEAKKDALALLSISLGRVGTHYRFLPQRPQNPVLAGSHTGSGLMVGRVKGTRQRPYFQTRDPLFSGDVLRVGYEDEPWHSIYRIKKSVPKNGHMHLKAQAGKDFAKGSPVFLTDRREKGLDDMLSGIEKELEPEPIQPIDDSGFLASLPGRSKRRVMAMALSVRRMPSRGIPRHPTGIWLSEGALRLLPRRSADQFWWWLPPVIWPDGEDGIRALLDEVLRNQAKQFVLNAPWQIGLFRNVKGLSICAGPFCNAANGLDIKTLQLMGFDGVIVSPELGQKDILALPQQSPLPLGIVISGNWPLCISRVLSNDFRTGQVFASPRGEEAWVKKSDSNFWVYPNWKLDLQHHKGMLQKAGYSLFIHLNEPIPEGVKLKKRPGLWNWDPGLQ